MNGIIVIALLLVLAVPSARAQLLPTLGGERAGTSGFQFLKVPVDARGAALGESVVADANDVSALMWNPALAARLPGIQAGFHHTAYFVDVSLDFVGVTYRMPQGITLGASLQTMNSGEMKVTTEFEPSGTGETFRLIDVAAGFTLAQQLTDLFSYGITAKYIQESVAGLTASAGAPTPLIDPRSKEVIGIDWGVIPNLRNVPMVVYQSTDDPQVPPDSNQVAAREVAKARERWGGYEEFRYWEVSGQGHAPMLHTGGIAERISGFLERIP